MAFISRQLQIDELGNISKLWQLAEDATMKQWDYAVDHVFADADDIKAWLDESKIKEYYRLNSFIFMFNNYTDAIAFALRFN